MKERKNMWEIKQAAQQSGVLEIYIYGEVESDGYDWWTDEVIRSETSGKYLPRGAGRNTQILRKSSCMSTATAALYLRVLPSITS